MIYVTTKRYRLVLSIKLMFLATLSYNQKPVLQQSLKVR